MVAAQTQMDPERAQFLSRIAPVGDNPGPFKGLIYGYKGVGKTTLCAGGPGVVLIDTENGRRSMMNHPELSKVPILDVHSWNDVDELAWAYRDGDLQKYLLEKYGVLKVQTFVIDTVSALAGATARELLAKEVERNTNRNPFLISQSEYKIRNELFTRLLTDWVTLGVNIVLTAHVTEVKDESDGHLYLRPSVSDTMADFLGGFVDLQGFMSITEGERAGEYVRHLQVHPTRRVDAKTRIGGLPPVIDNPNLSDLIMANQSVAKDGTPPTKDTVKI